MKYLNAQLQTPPPTLTVGGITHPVRSLIEREDNGALAELDIYPKVPDAESSSLGYTEYELVNGQWVREPNGTPEEREAAELNQRRADLQAQRSAATVAHQTGGFVYQGDVYASDLARSIPLLQATITAIQLTVAAGAPMDQPLAMLGDGWRSDDGVARLTTPAEMISLWEAFIAHGAACDAAGQAFKAQIDAAETLADLDAVEAAIADPANWPD